MTTPHNTSQIRIQPITNAEDFQRCFEITASAFGTQTADGIWKAFHPGWDTPEGRVLGASRMQSRWAASSLTSTGSPNVVYLKATVLDPSGPGAGLVGKEGEVIAGMAIWVQASMVPGNGDLPPTDLVKALELDTLYPGDESAQKFLCQVVRSLTKSRLEAVKEAETRDPPAILALDLCAVDPAFQRRGIAAELVKWGLEEAQRRGGLEAVTEASKKGRGVYAKLGFEQQGEIEYLLDDEFRDRMMPSNVFMRTGTSPKTVLHK
ncbi:hypothetical protein BKA65DRAFT_516942 [Rhexocercosporidium sp. MPI-PUGE-AT-0058]|nr:hypothetical protein BKA65DRAFT_516942 [Rhexocercosporidium sp. MPI-PUGE-AT-0058]